MWESSFWNCRLQWWWCCYSNSKTHKKNIYNWEVCCGTTVTIDNIGFDIQESKSHWFSWIFFYPDKPTTRRCFFEIVERLSSEIAIIVISFIWEFFDISGWEQIIYRSIRFWLIWFFGFWPNYTLWSNLWVQLTVLNYKFWIPKRNLTTMSLSYRWWFWWILQTVIVLVKFAHFLLINWMLLKHYLLKVRGYMHLHTNFSVMIATIM